jgi:hypothetical protein
VPLNPLLRLIDEVGYVPLAEVGAEFLFPGDCRTCRADAVIMTTNLPVLGMDASDPERTVMQSQLVVCVKQNADYPVSVERA